MAGSIKTFEYQTATNDFYAVNMDESNGVAVGNQDFTPTSTATVFIPRNIKPRFASYRSANGLYQRRIIVTDPTATVETLPASIAAQDGNGGTVTVLLTQLTGERVTVFPKAEDTAITDGTAT